MSMHGAKVIDSKMQRVGHYSKHVETLIKACEWAALPHGRSKRYIKLNEELFESYPLSRERVLAYNESCEVTDIYELWEPHVGRFPGLHEKIKECLLSGPILQEDENPHSSSNIARNNAFVLLLAGKLIRAGINVIAVEGVLSQNVSCHTDADITFEWDGALLDIQCKRPQRMNSLERRAREAINQINTSNRPGQLGIIAVDCSSLIRPPGKLLERYSPKIALQDVTDLLQESVMPIVRRFFEPNIMLFHLFTRVPAVTIIEESPILSLMGEPFRTYRPESVSASLIVTNDDFINPELLDSISERLESFTV